MPGPVLNVEETVWHETVSPHWELFSGGGAVLAGAKWRGLHRLPSFL